MMNGVIMQQIHILKTVNIIKTLDNLSDHLILTSQHDLHSELLLNSVNYDASDAPSGVKKLTEDRMRAEKLAQRCAQFFYSSGDIYPEGGAGVPSDVN